MNWKTSPRGAPPSRRRTARGNSASGRTRSCARLPPEFAGERRNTVRADVARWAGTCAILPHVPEPRNVLETPRLTLRHFTLDDAPFAFELVNDPAWIEHIGDRKVRTLDDARGYIQKTLNMYESAGFGLYVVVSKETGDAVGICGLIRRAGLPDPDIGFAFLPKGRGKGYALESAAAVIAYGRNTLGMERIVAI